MTKEEKIKEISLILDRYQPQKNSRLNRLWKKRGELNNKKLNNLLKRFRLLKVFAEAL